MDLQLTEEHKMIRDMAREFAQNEIAPVAAHFDETGEFPYETVKKMGAQGFMGPGQPERDVPAQLGIVAPQPLGSKGRTHCLA